MTGAQRGSFPKESCTGNRRFPFSAGFIIDRNIAEYYAVVHLRCVHSHLRLISCLRTALRTFFAAVRSLTAKMAAMSTACQQRIALNDGRTMPSFGLGVWQAPLGACKAAVLHALRCGYRHIDTAEIYGNEQDVGDALAIFLKERPDVQREDIWITTKFFPRNGAGRAAVVRACRDSLRKLRLQYVDLYLIHAPHTRERLEQYRALEALRAEGLCRSIGVSNYGIHHLEELLAVCAVPPSVNQVRATSV